MKTVIGVASHSSRRMGHSSRAAQQPARAVEEQRRNQLVAENDHQHHAQHRLRNLRRGPAAGMRGVVKENRAELQRDQAQRQCCARTAAHKAACSRLRPRCGSIRSSHASRFSCTSRAENLAELGVDAADVGGQRLTTASKATQKDWSGVMAFRHRAGLRRGFADGRGAFQPVRSTPAAAPAARAEGVRAAPSGPHRFRGRIRPGAATREASAP